MEYSTWEKKCWENNLQLASVISPRKEGREIPIPVILVTGTHNVLVKVTITLILLSVLVSQGAWRVFIAGHGEDAAVGYIMPVVT